MAARDSDRQHGDCLPRFPTTGTERPYAAPGMCWWPARPELAVCFKCVHQRYRESGPAIGRTDPPM